MIPRGSLVSSTTVALLLIVLLVGAGSGALLQFSITNASQNDEKLRIDASDTLGVNRYTMVEVDDGDNEERPEVTLLLHNFTFTAAGLKDNALLTWDFGDGSTASGIQVNHVFEEAGIHTVRLTMVSVDSVEEDMLQVRVNLVGEVESDNMECTCAPTGKSTLIDLKIIEAPVTLEGRVNVAHDGSSESCSLRNPLQECHVRVLLEWVEAGDVVEQQELHDATFRENELIISFDLGVVDLDPGQILRLRLETDQLRDWHKPTTTWSMNS
ncbi:MAG: Uncharacterised protein [Methanobacteriota archaeon]|nr:MAG: Uncharacterised protein [Euryarchaeota archaeon]|tara:strand:+ start:90 stop:896 length:807 start_codon:yes stop_codon:yes gene_type:complete